MKFSITIPAYKSRFLNDCIQSVINQTYKDFELLILNDASPEDLDFIINQFSDDRIKYFKNLTNVGAKDVVYNWNNLLSKANGDYLLCIGDDDLLLPNCLAEYNELITKYPNLDVYHGWTEIIDEDGNIIKIQEARPEYETVYSMMWYRWNGRNQYIGDFLFKVTTLRELGGFYYLPLAWGSDDLTTYIAAEKKGIANTQVPVFQYRENGLSITTTANSNFKFEAIILEDKWYRKFFNRDVRLIGTDIVYHKMLTQGLNRYFMRKKVSLLRKEFNRSSYVRTGVYWFYNMKKYELNVKIILKAMLNSIMSKYS